jgi:hypothetical protein
MFRLAVTTMACVIVLGFCLPLAAFADDDPVATVALVVKTGTPIHVALDERVRVTRVGQVLTGRLAEPVYAYDRVVLPAGITVRGRVAALEPPSRLARVRQFASGDFSPHRHIVVQFDTLVLSGAPSHEAPSHEAGDEIAIRTVVTGVTDHATLQVAAAPDQPRIVARARQEVAQRVSEALDTITAPGKMDRVKEAVINRLPYHPQYLRKGTVFTAELLAPVEFGSVPGVPRAASGTPPAPESILSARLLTPLDSATSARGATIRAVVTHPVFSAAHELIMPEGVVLEGVVTFARAARHYHRNGQLRFLFQTVHPPAQDPVTLLASLYAVRVNDADGVAVDEEGGAAVKNSNTRFIAPALAILALRAATHRELDEADEPGQIGVPAQVNYGNPALGGFFGWGLLGAAASQIARPVGVGLSIVGVVRTVYGSVFGNGREVVFPVDTPIQLQLAPARATGQ